jgi:hypothetical protein
MTMGYNMRQVYRKKLIDVATAAVSSVTVITAWFDMCEANRASFHMEWGGSTGTFALCKRNDPTATLIQDHTPLFKNPSGSADTDDMDMTDMNANEYCLKYTRVSGTTGPIEVWVHVDGT